MSAPKLDFERVEIDDFRLTVPVAQYRLLVITYNIAVREVTMLRERQHWLEMKYAEAQMELARYRNEQEMEHA